MTKHLDLGCGANPRNTYNAENLYGIDILERHDSTLNNFTYKSANVILEKIPFEDNFFDSISAFDFIEHIILKKLPFIWHYKFFYFINFCEIFKVL